MSRLADLQYAIDQLDDEIVDLMARRFEHSRRIGAIKQRLGKPPFDPERIRAQDERWVRRCVDRGLNGAMARQLIAIIVSQVLVERFENIGSAPASLAPPAEADERPPREG